MKKVWEENRRRFSPESVYFFISSNSARQSVLSTLKTSMVSSHLTTLINFAIHVVETYGHVRTLTTDEQVLTMHRAVSESRWNSGTGSFSFTSDLITQYSFFVKNQISLEPYCTCSEKHQILHDIFTQYEHSCGSDILPLARVYERAIELIEAGTVPIKYAVFYHLDTREPLIRRLLDAIRSKAEVSEFVRPEYPLTAPPTLCPTIWNYKTARDEIEMVLDQCCQLLDEGCSPEDILILSPSVTETADIISNVIDDFYYKAKATDAETEDQWMPLQCTPLPQPLRSYPMIQCVLAALSAIRSGYKLEDLETVVASSRFVCPDERKDEWMSVGELHRISILANVTEKKSGWMSAIHRLGQHRSSHHSAKKLKALIEWIDGIASSAERQTYAERASHLKSWLQSSGWLTCRAHPRDLALRRIFVGYLDSISKPPTGEFTCTLLEFSAALDAFAGDRREEGKFSHGIRLVSLSEADDLRVPYVFIVGLTEKCLPRIVSVIPPFSQKETADLCRLPDGTPFSFIDRQIEEQQSWFASALQTATRTLYLSCHRANGTSATSPSSYLTRIGEPADYLVNPAPRHSIWYNQITAGTFMAKTETDEPPLLPGVEGLDTLAVRIERESWGYYSDFSESPVASTFAAEYGTDTRVFYPTELELYISCPYRWYLSKYLHLQNPQETHSEPLETGNAIHRALKRFFSRVSCEDLKSGDFDTLYATLIAEIRAAFDEEQSISSPSWEVTRRKYLGEIPGRPSVFRTFLEHEIQNARDGWETTEPMTEYELDRENGIPITYGDMTIRIGGMVDRIMVNRKTGTFRIIDYKTGKAIDKKRATAVQIPLYTAAFAAEHPDLDSEIGYYLLLLKDPGKDMSPKGLMLKPNLKKEEDTQLMERVFSLVKDAHEGMATGRCNRLDVYSPDKNCKYCPFSDICRVPSTSLNPSAAVSGGEEE